MRTIPNIKLTTQELQQILNSSITSGGEGIICKSNSNNTAYKIFINPKTEEVIPMLENKQRKIIRQCEQPLEYAVRPISTISTEDYIIGYEMEYDEKERPLEALTPPRIELIDYLKEIKKALEYFQSKDIIYGDIKASNILVNRQNGQVRFCDMDNIAYRELPIDLVPYDLGCYKHEHGCIDDLSHAYFHNLLSIEQLLIKGVNYQDILYKLSTGAKPKGFKKTANPIFESMVRAENFTGEYAIDHVKKKDIRIDKTRNWKG